MHGEHSFQKRVVQGMKPREQMIFQGRFIDRESEKEMAKKYNLTLANVKQIIYRIRDAIGKKLPELKEEYKSW